MYTSKKILTRSSYGLNNVNNMVMEYHRKVWLHWLKQHIAMEIPILHNDSIFMIKCIFIPYREKSMCTSICNLQKIEWFINMLALLSFKPYAKLISLCVRLVSPLRCATLTNEDTPSHDIP